MTGMSARPPENRDELHAEVKAYAQTDEGKRLVTRATFAETLVDIARATKQHIVQAIAPGEKRLDALERRVADLEARPVGLNYCGTWQDGQTYRLHDAVTHHGGIWVCRAMSVQSEPGRDPIGWQLAARGGRDARQR